ncbi:hypothetical protein H6F98_12950 [Microcoleus sp. FACHB-SPT15]|jgi:hypothetical protein|uniref:hypothetical protein n=1 Tax=Microcoleus sp. FACHB-SPT15 TaxID=2692830 RepID=UPI001780FCC6|nr:hypothetical protein [Microcoleus sp. FACHB-SPT15]MBD1806353.1 hypothetical protein [Microcoleus sp. FACHB-SPT15]
MEIVAIVILGLSVLIGFSTKENQPKPDTNNEPDNDPDSVFKQPYDMDSSKEQLTTGE